MGVAERLAERSLEMPPPQVTRAAAELTALNVPGTIQRELGSADGIACWLVGVPHLPFDMPVEVDAIIAPS